MLALVLGFLAVPGAAQTSQSLIATAAGTRRLHHKVKNSTCEKRLPALTARQSSPLKPACRASAGKSPADSAKLGFSGLPSQANVTAPLAGTQGRASAQEPQSLSDFSGRFWSGGQINVIAQGNPPFDARYSGPHSFENYANDNATSLEDLFTGARITRNLEVLFDVEDVRGSGLSGVVGMAGFPNLDAQRAPSTGGGAVHTYMSRFLLHYIVPLGGGTVENTPSNLELRSSLPARRLEFYFGKFSLADFFDHNAYANDDHSQFMNWTADQNGAWDFAANTSGYTYGAYAEFDDHNWSFRYAEVLMTKKPNGHYLSARITNSKAANAQIGWAYNPATHGKIRLLGFIDQAPMGSFSNALAAWRAGLTTVPETSAVRRPGAHEYGFGLNWQQGLPHHLGLFARAGWNNGKYESYSFTEVNNTIEGGIQIPGALWGRPQDHAGLAFISNGISGGHQEYLAAGGQGFMLGDGNLTYGREDIFETYYNLHLPAGFSIAPDIQYVQNPGYNQVRGPVVVLGMRLHIHLGFHNISF